MKLLLALSCCWLTQALACEPLLARFAQDCQLQDRTREVTAEFHRRGIDVKQIASYRALRFIDRHSWEKHLSEGKVEPWNVYQPAPSTWMQWEHGQMRADRIEITEQDHELALEDIRDIHRYAMGKGQFTRTSYFLKGARPGKIRSSWFARAPEFWVKCSWGITSEGQELMANYDIADGKGRPLIEARLQLCADGKNYEGHVMYMPSRRVPVEIQRWLTRLNEWLESYYRGEENILSPVEAIADLQRRFVSIHPFGDGNGRVSRYIQDFLFDAIGIAYPASADLQNDLLTPATRYRSDVRAAIIRNLDFLENCLHEMEHETLSKGCTVLQQPGVE